MARRNEGFLDDLVYAPWWVSTVLAAVVYLGIRFGSPILASKNQFLYGIFSGLESFAWIGAIFLIPAAISALDSQRKKRQLDRQTSLDSIRSLSWKQFEELLAEAYRRRGFSVVENRHAGADGGVDIRITRGGMTYLVQCKQWRVGKVGVKVVREMLGLVAAHKAAGAVVVTSGTFTNEARDFAASQPVELLDGHALTQLLADLQPQAQIRVASPAAETRLCPKCGSSLVLRKARRGAHAGSEFWGCSGYPDCRHIEAAV